MVSNLRYRSTIKSQPFFFTESKKLTTLLLQGLNEYELREQVIDRNILQLTNIARRKEVASVILRRLNVLDQFLLERIEKNSVETGKCIVLYTIMKTDRLFYEFMHEVIYEKTLILDMSLTDAQINDYFETKKLQSDIVANWSDYTIYKLRQVYKRVLTEAGLLIRNGKKLQIQRPIIDPIVTKYIKKIETVKFIPIIFGGDR